MVRKPAKRPRRGAAKKGTAKAGTVRERIIAAALELAASEGWRPLSLSDIATRAGVTLADLHKEFPCKPAILCGFIDGIDERVLAEGAADEGDSARDRLFDVLMRRFDALNPYKAGVVAIVRESCLNPAACLVAGPRLLCSMAWMLEAAGLSSTGLGGLVRAKGLSLVYASAFCVWMRDDTADMSRTMAALDKGLRRAETLAGLCGLGRREGPNAEAEAA